MKTLAMVAALVALSGCVQVDDYSAVVKAPAPADLAGNWQSKGPQSSLVSPEAIGSLVITPEGDTLDCRQWQRVIAVPGKLMLRSGTLYNVTAKREIYEVERAGSTLEYDGMTLEKVERPTQACADYLATDPLNDVTP